MLDTIITGIVNKPPRIIIYGAEGVGKTTFASQAPKPIFIQTEDGSNSLDVARFPVADDYPTFFKQLESLAAEDHAFQTLVIDSLTRLETIIYEEVCKADGVATIDKVAGGYGKGFDRALAKWREVITACDWLRDNKNMNIIMVAHRRIETFNDPSGAPYDRYTLALDKKATTFVTAAVDAVIYAYTKIRVATEKNARSGKAAPIGEGAGERVMRADTGPQSVSKARAGFNFNGEMPLSWQAFANKVSHE